ncbi:hypothetical protein WMF28_38435 [Sorangium sp. So ce590]|uniref:hypothetical protein n=1 Tax=Sorangium sp. So ce590 TaxID=3133317 RepID=UPI003F5E58B2
MFQETVIDANGKSRNTYRDVGGRIAAVEEWNTIDEVGQPIVTRYEHNPVGELVRVTDARNNATTATYLAAGQAEIAAAGGRVVGMKIVPHSGHFMPSLESLQIGIQAFPSTGSASGEREHS